MQSEHPALTRCRGRGAGGRASIPASRAGLKASANNADLPVFLPLTAGGSCTSKLVVKSLAAILTVPFITLVKASLFWAS